MTREELNKKQPNWCNYPEAARPIWGCWSLLNGNIKSEEDCKICERYIIKEQ